MLNKERKLRQSWRDTQAKTLSLKPTKTGRGIIRMRKCGATSRQPSRIFCSSERGNRHLMFDVYSCSTGSGSCLGPRVGFGLRPVVKVTLLMTMLLILQRPLCARPPTPQSLGPLSDGRIRRRRRAVLPRGAEGLGPQGGRRADVPALPAQLRLPAVHHRRGRRSADRPGVGEDIHGGRPSVWTSAGCPWCPCAATCCCP